MLLKNDKFFERCGVFGIVCNDFCYSVANMIYSGLMAIQHRGQLGAGISTTNCNGKISTHIEKGLVSKALNPKRLKMFSGNVGIGHVSYGGSRIKTINDLQPYYFKSDQLEFSIAMNGVLSNYTEIDDKLKNMGKILTDKSDIELIAALIETFSKFCSNMPETLKMVINSIKGAYTLMLLDNSGNLYALRDPSGCKPLCYGEIKKKDNRVFYIISSESCSLDVIGAELIDDIKPGEIIHLSPIDSIRKYESLVQEKRIACFFEYTYFARPDSIIDGRSIAQVRDKLGKNLAKNEKLKLEDAIVVPVPDSGRSAAMGYAWEANLTYYEGLMKNRYIWELKSTPEEKLNTIKPVVKNKNIILIDDSIISGNTLRKIISMLRAAGALSVHVRIGCPPIINNCNLNTSFSNKNMLIAFEKKVANYDNFNEEMRIYIGADSLMYQSIDSLVDAIGEEKPKICLQCLMEYCLVNNDEIEKKKTSDIKLINQ
jgi:amidophosphoribosyltransferase